MNRVPRKFHLDLCDYNCKHFLDGVDSADIDRPDTPKNGADGRLFQVPKH